uniref:Uncharacterized protein n=1 Tax=Ascaris lumbricoides TaxID=6252 RepID=A0A9J2PKN0_ASCLU
MVVVVPRRNVLMFLLLVARHSRIEEHRTTKFSANMNPSPVSY